VRKNPFLLVTGIILLVILPIALYFVTRAQVYIGKAREQPANILVDASIVTGPLPHNWQALAQGGEEQGVRMLENVVPQVRDLSPRYIRIDHIYDFYNVVSRDSSGNIQFTWNSLDQTICNILATGATPFLSLGYMPPALSVDGSLISQPSNWNEWTLLVQKTIERYSGTSTNLCGGGYGDQLNDVYYEVWNEPDLEHFGKWSLYGGEKDYKVLYKYSSIGADRATNVRRFFLGGPATTLPYRNWLQKFLEYADANNLRVDFLSWHHYSPDPDRFGKDVIDVKTWLEDPKYSTYRNLPLVISEWGYDSAPNPVAHTNFAAAHAVVAILNLANENLEHAFMFEIKDGKTPTWGIISQDGTIKPRYRAISFLNALGSRKIALSGEGTYVRGIATRDEDTISMVMVNFDPNGSHNETVPITIRGLTSGGHYTLTQRSLSGSENTIKVQATNRGIFTHLLYFEPNTAYSWELKPV
jgi:hypothetical protein